MLDLFQNESNTKRTVTSITLSSNGIQSIQNNKLTEDGIILQVIKMEFNEVMKRYLVQLSDGYMYCSCIFNLNATTQVLSGNVVEYSIISIKSFNLCKDFEKIPALSVTDFEVLKREVPKIGTPLMWSESTHLSSDILMTNTQTHAKINPSGSSVVEKESTQIEESKEKENIVEDLKKEKEDVKSNAGALESRKVECSDQDCTEDDKGKETSNLRQHPNDPRIKATDNKIQENFVVQQKSSTVIDLGIPKTVKVVTHRNPLDGSLSVKKPDLQGENKFVDKDVSLTNDSTNIVNSVALSFPEQKEGTVDISSKETNVQVSNKKPPKDHFIDNDNQVMIYIKPHHPGRVVRDENFKSLSSPKYHPKIIGFLNDNDFTLDSNDVRLDDSSKYNVISMDFTDNEKEITTKFVLARNSQEYSYLINREWLMVAKSCYDNKNVTMPQMSFLRVYPKPKANHSDKVKEQEKIKHEESNNSQGFNIFLIIQRSSL